MKVHAYERVARNAIRLVYQVPLVIKEPNNFNTNIISVRIVIEYDLDPLGGMKNGRLITLFIQNGKLNDDDIDTFLNLCPEIHFWGWDLVTVTNYINQVGCKSLPNPEPSLSTAFYVLPSIPSNNIHVKNRIDPAYPGPGINKYKSIERSEKFAIEKVAEILIDPDIRKVTRQAAKDEFLGPSEEIEQGLDAYVQQLKKA